MSAQTWLFLLGLVSLPIVLLALFFPLTSWLTRRSGQRAFKKGALLERAGDYKGACWVYAGAAEDSPRRRECHERIRDLWRRNGPFDYAEKVAEIERADYVDETCRSADLAFVRGTIKRMEQVVAGADLVEPMSTKDSVMLLLSTPSPWVSVWWALTVAVVTYGIGHDLLGILPSVAKVVQRWPSVSSAFGAVAFLAAAFVGGLRQLYACWTGRALPLEVAKEGRRKMVYLGLTPPDLWFSPTFRLGTWLGVAILSTLSAATVATLSQPLPLSDSAVSPFFLVFSLILALRWAVSAALSIWVARRLGGDGARQER
jgi:hypothetical protein